MTKSLLKKDGLKMFLLKRVALYQEWGFPTDMEGFPPSKVMKPLLKRGYVYMKRRHRLGWRSIRPFGVNRWFLTDKGKQAVGYA